MVYKSLFVVFELLCKLKAVIIDATMLLHDLKNGVLIKIVDLLIDELEELNFHLVHSVFEPGSLSTLHTLFVGKEFSFLIPRYHSSNFLHTTIFFDHSLTLHVL